MDQLKRCFTDNQWIEASIQSEPGVSGSHPVCDKMTPRPAPVLESLLKTSNVLHITRYFSKKVMPCIA